MKEVGETFKIKREEMGISKEEASNDLNVEVLLIDALEDGNNKAFKDIYELRELIKVYAKYLGLDQESIIDEFNDYIFGATSKITKEDLMMKTSPKIVKEISSPYTKRNIKKLDKKFLFLIIGALVLILIILFILLRAYIFKL